MVWEYESLRGEEYAPLKPEEERELILKAKSGDKRAKNRVIKSNYRYIFKLAKNFSIRFGVPYEDLISEGILALFEAFENFDAQKGFRFLTYAIDYVKGAMWKYIKSLKPLTHMSSLSRKEYLKIVQLYQKLGREPTLEDIAKELGISEKKAKNIVDSIRVITYRLEGGEVEDEGEGFASQASTEPDIIEEQYQIDRLNEFLGKVMEEISSGDLLTDKEKRVLWENIFEEKSLAEIARSMGCSREYTRQLKESAKKKLLKKYPELRAIGDL